jgi:hypothetical protein
LSGGRQRVDEVQTANGRAKRIATNPKRKTVELRLCLANVGI